MLTGMFVLACNSFTETFDLAITIPIMLYVAPNAFPAAFGCVLGIVKTRGGGGGVYSTAWSAGNEVTCTWGFTAENPDSSSSLVSPSPKMISSILSSSV